ncbi:hypothetical protein AVEN_3740-1 [Araneus ventricosus]|uniref:Uncharacterized protein n=1 Tax=Araneus ventricosus TaxID=182803 RepID=A0A4Y2K7J9_ARAVE|nr:hypothetical protein AVEN_3740-1 [Araneus ventricosus]
MGLSAEVLSCSSDRISEVQGPSQNNRVASNVTWDVNIALLNQTLNSPCIAPKRDVHVTKFINLGRNSITIKFVSLVLLCIYMNAVVKKCNKLDDRNVANGFITRTVDPFQILDQFHLFIVGLFFHVFFHLLPTGPTTEYYLLSSQFSSVSLLE